MTISVMYYNNKHDYNSHIKNKGGMNITNNLKYYRNKSGYRQKDAAAYINVTPRHYQRLEAKTPYSVEQFYKIANYFNTTIDNLLEQNADSPK